MLENPENEEECAERKDSNEAHEKNSSSNFSLLQKKKAEKKRSWTEKYQYIEFFFFIFYRFDLLFVLHDCCFRFFTYFFLCENIINDFFVEC